MTNYWFGLKQKGGRAIAIGPHKTHEAVSEARQKAKAPDMDVSIWFVADTDAEAQEKAVLHLP
jgi:hypothetical protein